MNLKILGQLLIGWIKNPLELFVFVWLFVNVLKVYLKEVNYNEKGKYL